ncbi:MAG: UDP-N-acetylmuramate dehydrogenase [Bacteroidia bacterium]|nr:UDP-N-acetylmuramate dehydrogenase [Bacteroidia bacterium]MBP9689759.1 UDP-N-acetylmuramate dehydrogenase [Bacteroidia bacterium]
MYIQQNISLKEYNTFGIDVKAKEFVLIDTLEELCIFCAAFNLIDRKLLILGGGSNVLLTSDFDGMAIKMNLKGIEVISENQNNTWIKVMAGEVWHDFVMYCVNLNLCGVENLSLIPGCVGAAPMQNIGAYGVEIKDTFDSLEAVEITTGNMVKFSKDECNFGYRESIFKHEAKGKYIISSVIFKLSKQPILNTSYGAIQQVLTEKQITNPTVKDVSDAVVSIRQSKLPNPKILGNAGSFFKNPEISAAQFASLQVNFPGIVGYPASAGNIKVAAGWMIEQCGWKGKIVGHTGSHVDQALVLVNYGGATGHEIWQLALDIQASVLNKFGVTIVPEVNVV